MLSARSLRDCAALQIGGKEHLSRLVPVAIVNKNSHKEGYIHDLKRPCWNPHTYCALSKPYAPIAVIRLASYSRSASRL